MKYACIGLLTVVGCASKPAAPPPSKCELALKDTAAADRWWESELEGCPQGAKTVTMGEEDVATFCALADGVRHGPFRAQAKGEVTEEGTMLLGERHGSWRRYDGVLRSWVQEKWSCGTVLERVAQPAPEAQ